MGCLLREGVVAISIGVLLFCISCEKHPLGQMPEVQREQADPSKAWSEPKNHPEEPCNSRKPAEAHEDR